MEAVAADAPVVAPARAAARTSPPPRGSSRGRPCRRRRRAGRPGSACSRLLDARASAGALCSGASASSSRDLAATSSSISTGSRKRAPPCTTRCATAVDTSGTSSRTSTGVGRVVVLDDVQLQARRAGVDDEDAAQDGQTQSRTSGWSSPCSRVHARQRRRRSTISCRSLRRALAEPGHAVDHVDDEVEAVEVVQHHHVERRRRRALLLVAAHVEVVVVRRAGRSGGGSATDSRGRRRRSACRVVKSASNSRSDRPCGCSDSGCSRIRSTTLTTRTFSSGRCSRRIAAAASVSSVGTSPQHASTTSGSRAVVVRRPLPDADAARAVHDRVVHRQVVAAPAACRRRSTLT